MTVGADHPRLPGLGLALVGLAPGGRVTLAVPAALAGWPYDPGRVYRLTRERFAQGAPPAVGRWVRLTDRRGRRRLVRVVALDGRGLVVDANHPLAGGALRLEVELVAVQGPAEAGPAGGGPLGRQARVLAFDVDASSLTCLREALPGWEVVGLRGASPGSLTRGWDPAEADLLVGVGGDVTGALGLCRFLAFCTSYSADFRQGTAGAPGLSPERRGQGLRADAPVLVLVPAGEGSLAQAALEAGAHSCLTLPIHAGQVASMLADARAGNRPGRHTLNREQPRPADSWRDVGGEA